MPAEEPYQGKLPDPVVQDMRKLNRRIFDLLEDITYNQNKLEAALQRCGFRLSNYVSTITGASYRKVVKAISKGKTNPGELIRKVHGRVISKHGKETITAAITGSFSDCDITVIRQYWDMLTICLQQSDKCHKKLTAMCETHFPKEYKRLQTIPGVKERATSAIIAETGVDMKMFATAAMLVGWCGLKPRNDVSNGHFKSRKITHGNKYLRHILIEISWVAS